MGGANKHRSLIAPQIVDSIGGRYAFCIRAEVVIHHRGRLETPDPAGVLEVAHQFLLLGIHADDRQALSGKAASLLVNALELKVTIRMRFGEGLDVGVKAIAELMEKAADGAWAYPYVPLLEFLGDLIQAFVRPHPAASHRITCGGVFEQIGEDLQEFGCFFSTFWRPPPLRRTR